jgi:hypothetical protein
MISKIFVKIEKLKETGHITLNSMNWKLNFQNSEEKFNLRDLNENFK